MKSTAIIPPKLKTCLLSEGTRGLNIPPAIKRAHDLCRIKLRGTFGLWLVDTIVFCETLRIDSSIPGGLTDFIPCRCMSCKLGLSLSILNPLKFSITRKVLTGLRYNYFNHHRIFGGRYRSSAVTIMRTLDKKYGSGDGGNSTQDRQGLFFYSGEEL